MGTNRSRFAGLLGIILVAAPFLLLVFAELVTLVLLWDVMGWWMMGLLALSTLTGALLLRREWSKSWAGLSESLRQGTLPPGRTVDAMLILIGGFLLITPGFITDLAGLLLLLPISRPLVRSNFGRMVARAVFRTGRSRPTPEIIPGVVVSDSESPGDPSKTQ